MRSSWKRIIDWCLSRKAIGTDKQGNIYFEETRQTGSFRKRFVKYRNESIPDVHSVPVEWWSWLHYMRENPPSEQEILNHEAHRSKVAEKVAKIEAEDRKQRLKQFVSSTSSGESYGEEFQQALRYLAQQRGLNDTLTDKLAKNNNNENKDYLEKSSLQKNVDEDLSESSPEEPKGYGEGFQPGTWKPSSESVRRGRRT
ncbi:hypothetical protein GpartN1_g1657.t1 [Galdieria partita]|uniref:NADH dehydrogenase [ubiquinone] 1 alpha subcomplex subunit 12 n=1 Tax=Galdieria partita TaxID=83374 RepID=A0A9C7UNU3_9RHOD|nr:hypothetical protein GpartN1_g1657.t1 [Galdieria partita]